MTLPPHVPETDFGNIPAPVGWIVGPCGQFHPNPASEVNGPGSVAWSIPCYTESSMRAYATAAVLAEREALDSSWEALRVWKEEGERITERHAHNFMFYIGVWWADRPWRDRPTD